VSVKRILFGKVETKKQKTADYNLIAAS
jgi:hypothetical protein